MGWLEKPNRTEIHSVQITLAKSKFSELNRVKGNSTKIHILIGTFNINFT